jgi:hypothetical protein
MNELGHADWPDAHPEIACLPQEFEADSAPVLVIRVERPITLISCICTDGSLMRPLLIIPWLTVDANLRMFGTSQEQTESSFEYNELIMSAQTLTELASDAGRGFSNTYLAKS